MPKKLDLNNVVRAAITMGCDPEFFFATKKRRMIRGAERTIPKTGLVLDESNYLDKCAWRSFGEKVVLDGVQAEIHAKPHDCRAYLANEIHACFFRLRQHLEENPDLIPSFQSVVKIGKKELDSLSDDAKKFGCAPSKNTYRVKSKITVDPAKYTTRSAGGHIHIGRCSTGSVEALAKPEILVPVLDVLLGNTCVLLDRDPMMAERRKLYGKAGEYRTPAHGIEYRVLSNFWLRAYPLMSFVMSMTRFSVSVVAMGKDYYDALLSLVSLKDIQQAINKNDFNLALKNFNKITPFIEATTPADYLVANSYPLTKINIPLFKHVVEKGIDYWFDHDIVNHWADLPNADSHHQGWGTFLRKKVRPDYEKVYGKKIEWRGTHDEGYY